MCRRRGRPLDSGRHGYPFTPRWPAILTPHERRQDVENEDRPSHRLDPVCTCSRAAARRRGRPGGADWATPSLDGRYPLVAVTGKGETGVRRPAAPGGREAHPGRTRPEVHPYGADPGGPSRRRERRQMTDGWHDRSLGAAALAALAAGADGAPGIAGLEFEVYLAAPEPIFTRPRGSSRSIRRVDLLASAAILGRRTALPSSRNSGRSRTPSRTGVPRRRGRTSSRSPSSYRPVVPTRAGFSPHASPSPPGGGGKIRAASPGNRRTTRSGRLSPAGSPHGSAENGRGAAARPEPRGPPSGHLSRQRSPSSDRARKRPEYEDPGNGP